MTSAHSKSSFSVFNDVDNTVAKPVLGSDAAARWQDFRQVSKLPTKSSVAPAMPLKRADRALGTTSLRDEQANEAQIRRDAGDREVGAGYEAFSRKTDHEEIAAAKKKKLVLERVRPDDVPYFLPAEAFEGYKFDYVFKTTDTRGTGYYWDGTDSRHKEMGNQTYAPADEDSGAAATKKTKTKTKKKRPRPAAVVPAAEPFNPMEQISQAILRRQRLAGEVPGLRRDEAAATAKADAAALGAVMGSSNTSALAAMTTTLEPDLAVAGWEAATDPTSGKLYYFRRGTDERSWSKPALPPESARQTAEGPHGGDAGVASAAASGGDASASKTAASTAMASTLKPGLVATGWESATDPTSGKLYYFCRGTDERSWSRPALPPDANPQGAAPLPEGWKAARDQTSGKTYYYNTSGKTSWEKPLP